MGSRCWPAPVSQLPRGHRDESWRLWKSQKGQEEGRDRKLDGDKQGRTGRERHIGNGREGRGPGSDKQATPGKPCPLGFDLSLCGPVTQPSYGWEPEPNVSER